MMTLIPIRTEYLQYMKGLGYSAPEIRQAWKEVQVTGYTDFTTLELMTRDLLSDPETAKETMAPYITKTALEDAPMKVACINCGQLLEIGDTDLFQCDTCGEYVCTDCMWASDDDEEHLCQNCHTTE